MVYLQIFGLAVGMLSALIGYSTAVFGLTNPWLLIVSQAYTELISKRELTDRQAIWYLLRFTRGDIASVDSMKEFADYGAMRRWKEVRRLKLEPGKIDQRQEHFFAAMHPLYGYTDKGDECMVIGFREFHYLYSNRMRSLQQKMAFLILTVSFFIQLLGILLPW